MATDLKMQNLMIDFKKKVTIDDNLTQQGYDVNFNDNMWVDDGKEMSDDE